VARLGAASKEVPRIDAALSAWRQGDLTLDSGWFIHAGDSARALTDEAAAVEEAGPTALTSEVAGLVIITQTCDIVRSCLERPFIEVCPLVEVDASRLREIERGRRPSHAYVPAVAERGMVADLDRVMTVEKSIVSDWVRTPGWTSDAQGRAFAATLARKRVRFAFPDDFTMFVGKLQSRLADKHDKNSEEGRALRALREVRVTAAPSWDADPVSIMFWFVRHDDSLEFAGKGWADWLVSWLKLVPSTGRFTKVDGQVAALAEMTAADYVDSDPLDLDHVTQRGATGT
jgi:hypothetical protein